MRGATNTHITQQIFWTILLSEHHQLIIENDMQLVIVTIAILFSKAHILRSLLCLRICFPSSFYSSLDVAMAIICKLPLNRNCGKGRGMFKWSLYREFSQSNGRRGQAGINSLHGVYSWRGYTAKNGLQNPYSLR